MSTCISERVKKYRDNLRASGLRPVQIWIPDTRKKGFADECRRQSMLLANDVQETEILEWLDEVSDTSGWTA